MIEHMSAPLFDELWDYNDPAGTEQRLREALPDIERSGDQERHAQLLTQIARTLSLQRRFDEAHTMIDRAEALAADGPAARVRCLLERGRTFNSVGLRDRAALRFEQAWSLATAAGETFHAIDAAHMLGIVATAESGMEWNQRALELADRAEDTRTRRWIGSLCNNIAWALHERGKFEPALAMFERALAARQESGIENDIRVAQWCIARCLRSLGRVEEALAMQRQLARDHEQHASDDGFVHEELGECLLALGRDDEAKPHFARAHAMLAQDAWLAQREPQRIERLKELGR